MSHSTNTAASQRAFGPTVAGRFYPDDPSRLRAMVEKYLAEAEPQRAVDPNHRIVAIVAPHAGYVFSGGTAGVAYSTAKRGDIRTVVVLSPSHHGRRPHACVLSADAYRTPLGTVSIAREVRDQLVSKGGDLVEVDEDLFAPEHAADVHIPFVQLAFPSAKVVPVIVPMMPTARLEALGTLLHEVVGADAHTLVVASSDLSHFYDYDEARTIDDAIVSEIVRKDLAAVLDKHDKRRGPCGVAPIVATMAYLAKFGDGGTVTRLQVLNSGDTRPETKSRVVGYAALTLSVPR